MPLPSRGPDPDFTRPVSSASLGRARFRCHPGPLLPSRRLPDLPALLIDQLEEGAHVAPVLPPVEALRREPARAVDPDRPVAADLHADPLAPGPEVRAHLG